MQSTSQKALTNTIEKIFKKRVTKWTFILLCSCNWMVLVVILEHGYPFFKCLLKCKLKYQTVANPSLSKITSKLLLLQPLLQPKSQGPKAHLSSLSCAKYIISAKAGQRVFSSYFLFSRRLVFDKKNRSKCAKSKQTSVLSC